MFTELDKQFYDQHIGNKKIIFIPQPKTSEQRIYDNADVKRLTASLISCIGDKVIRRDIAEFMKQEVGKFIAIYELKIISDKDSDIRTEYALARKVLDGIIQQASKSKVADRLMIFTDNPFIQEFMLEYKFILTNGNHSQKITGTLKLKNE